MLILTSKICRVLCGPKLYLWNTYQKSHNNLLSLCQKVRKLFLLKTWCLLTYFWNIWQETHKSHSSQDICHTEQHLSNIRLIDIFAAIFPYRIFPFLQRFHCQSKICFLSILPAVFNQNSSCFVYNFRFALLIEFSKTTNNKSVFMWNCQIESIDKICYVCWAKRDIENRWSVNAEALNVGCLWYLSCINISGYHQ